MNGFDNHGAGAEVPAPFFVVETHKEALLSISLGSTDEPDQGMASGVR
ncbi:MAG: hypothetical protein V3W37_07040 [Candidatus Binatia bacterium]